MKNQYCGDIGDYGKYGLLRHFAKSNIKIGVNWYFTPDDTTNDGKFILYLENESERHYDSELFDVLKQLVLQKGRNVKTIEDTNIIKDAVFYREILHSKDLLTGEERAEERKNWHKKALHILQNAELVFADPDNGAIGSKTVKDKESEKYIIPSEMVDYYQRGQNVVYYCQKARRTYDQWEATKSEMLTYLPEAKLCVLTYHRGTQRSYIFVIHPEHYREYINIIYGFLRTRWGKLFSEEFVDGKNPADEKKGSSIDIELKDGVVMNIQAQVDGWVKIQFSDQKNMSTKIKAEDFARYFR